MKLETMIVGAWAGEQLPVVSGTGMTNGEDLLEGHSSTTGVVLLTTVGVGLLCCMCAVFDPTLPTGNVQVTREVARRPCSLPFFVFPLTSQTPTIHMEHDEHSGPDERSHCDDLRQSGGFTQTVTPTRCAWDSGAHCRARFVIIWT